MLVHFQFEPDGQLTSPCVPSAAVRIDAYPGLITENTVAEARRQLRRVDALTNRTKLAALLPRGQSTPTPVVYAVANQTADNRQAMRRRVDGPRGGRGAKEFELRSQTISSVSNASVQLQAANNYNYLHAAAVCRRGTSPVRTNGRQ